METKTLDIQKLLSDYVDDLNVAVESRQFPPFVQKWFAVPELHALVQARDAGDREREDAVDAPAADRRRGRAA